MGSTGERVFEHARDSIAAKAVRKYNMQTLSYQRHLAPRILVL